MSLCEFLGFPSFGRFGYLAPLSHSVVTAQVGGKTWYRLRASGPDAAGICGRLQVAGEQCLKVQLRALMIGAGDSPARAAAAVG